MSGLHGPAGYPTRKAAPLTHHPAGGSAQAILLQAEMAELQANPDKNAVGTVIEAYLDKSRGPTATVLVQGGTLRMGDVVLVGATYGKVKALVADDGTILEQAGPSTPVQLLGLNATPTAGDLFEVRPIFPCTAMHKLRGGAGLGTGRQWVIGRWTDPSLSRRACTCEHGLQSWRRESAGVAKRPRERISHPKALIRPLFHKYPSDPCA